MVADGYPLLQKIPDVNEPASGYLWGDLAAHGKTYYHFGEFISSTFCNETAVADPQAGPDARRAASARTRPLRRARRCRPSGAGAVNKWPWPIPVLAANVATKPELVGHFAPEAPDFNLAVPDQIRVDIFLRHLKGWIADKAAGQRHHAQLHHAAPAQRSHRGNASRRSHAEIFSGR